MISRIASYICFQSSFKNDLHDLQTKSLKLPATKDFSENRKSEILEENSEHLEKRKLSQLGSRKEFYLRENEVKMARSTGIGIGDERLEGRNWILKDW